MRPKQVIAMAILLIVLVVAFTWIVIPMLYGSITSVSDFGAMFGFAGALFSGLALAGVVFAILLQREELGFQREELQATRQNGARHAVTP